MWAWLILSCFVLLMALVAIQDFESRAISAYLPVLVFIFSFLYSCYWFDIQEVTISTIINVALLFFQFALLYLYVRIFKEADDLTDSYLGWGDILFLLALGPLFSPLNFVLFNLVCFISIALGYFIYTGLNPKGDRHIPLAGLVAIITAFSVSFLNLTNLHNAMYDNYWLINTLGL